MTISFKPSPSLEQTGPDRYRIAQNSYKSPYLERKYIADSQNTVIDQNGTLHIPIYHAHNDKRISRQRILANGEKTLDKGKPVKNGVFFIGDMSEVGTGFVVEGYSDGATLHEATGNPVAVAFGAHNIKTIIEALKIRYPLISWIAAVNNDQAGRKAAEDCKALGFTTTSPDLKYNDFNDAWVSAIRNNQDAKKLVSGMVQGNITGRITINREFVSPSCIPYEARTVLIKSGLGTGKTQTLEKWIPPLVEAGKRVLYVALYQGLVNDASKRLGITDYMDLPAEIGEFSKAADNTQTLAICLNSIVKLSPQKWDVIIFDEAAQDFEQLTSPFLAKDRVVLWELFNHLLKAADKVLLLDGTGTESTVSVIREIRGGGLIVENEHRPAQDIALTIFESRAVALDKIFSEIEAGRRVIVPTDTDGQAIANAIRAKFPHLKGLHLNAKTGAEHGEVKKDEVLTDINQHLSDNGYDWCVFSPTIATGVSINAEHFDTVVGIFEGQTIGPRLVFQMMHRQRGKDKPRYIWLANRDSGRAIESAEELQQNFIDSHTSERVLLKIDDSGAWLPRDKEYMNFWATVTAESNALQNRWKSTVIALHKQQGYTIAENSTDDETASDAKKALSKAREAIRQERAALVIEKANQEPDELALARIQKAAEQGKPLDKEDRATLEAVALTEIVGGNITEKDVNKLPTYKRAARRAALILADEKDARETGMEEHRQSALLIDKRHIMTRRRLLLEALDLVGLEVIGGTLTKTRDVVWESAKDCQATISINEWKKRNARMISHCRLGDPTEGGVKFINQILADFCINVDKAERKKDGKKERRYSIKSLENFERLKPSKLLGHKVLRGTDPPVMYIEDDRGVWPEEGAENTGADGPPSFENASAWDVSDWIEDNWAYFLSLPDSERARITSAGS